MNIFCLLLCITLIICSLIHAEVEPVDLLAEAAFLNFDKVNDLIDAGLNPNLKDTQGYTPLLYAVKHKRFDTVEKILKVGGDPDYQENDGWVALSFAVVTKNYDMVKLLSSYGANPYLENDGGMSPMAFANNPGFEEILNLLLGSIHYYEERKVLLEKKAVLGQKLLEAAKSGDTDEMKNLIDLGVEVDNRNSHGWSALTYAAGVGNIDNINILLNAGSNVNQEENDGWTPIMFAAYRGHSHIIEILRDSGASFVSRTKAGVTVIGASKLNKDRDPNIHKMIASHALYECLKLGDQDICVEAVDEGGDLKLTSSLGWNAFHLFASHGFGRVMKRMMSYVFPEELINILNHQENDGWTPLMFAVINGNLNIIQTLIDNGADPNMVNFKGESAYDLALINNKNDIVEYFKSSNSVLTEIRTADDKARLGADTKIKYSQKIKTDTVAKSAANEEEILKMKKADKEAASVQQGLFGFFKSLF